MQRVRRAHLASRTEALFDKKQRRDEEDYSSGRQDPLRVYLRKMGGVSLLSRDGEVNISRRIEKGETRSRRAVLSIPSGRAKLFEILSVLDEDTQARIQTEVVEPLLALDQEMLDILIFCENFAAERVVESGSYCSINS